MSAHGSMVRHLRVEFSTIYSVALSTASCNLPDMEKEAMDVELQEVAKTDQELVQSTTVSESEEKHICRQFDRRVVPIVCVLYVLSYLDRGNIGNAKTAGAQDDLGLTSVQWTWVLNAFYICYVVFEWTTILWKVFPAHIYVAALCLLWGVAAMSAGSVHNMAHLIVCRAFLGIFEASFGAGAPYYLSLFHQRHELAFRTSLLLGMAPFANCFASALAYGISQIRNSLEPWRLIFLIEGAPTVLFAPVVFFFLPDSPNTAKFLKEHEQTQALERLHTRDLTRKSKIHWKQFLDGATDYRNISSTSAATIHSPASQIFPPTIVAGMGYSNINAQGLTAPVYFTSFLCCVGTALLGDRYGKRAFVIMGSALFGCVGYLLLAILENEKYNNVRYFAVWLAVCGVFPALSLNITWLLNNNTSESKRGAGLAILAIFGQCSSFLSSAMVPKVDG
ncbi:MFS transporter prlL [Pseudocercospora fuligena]|uniref:MFS transporter prlL n=1 Tax=Pseudocercospora fuligena TaxID=685502 RepID=A0A8H6RP87_9PEZI|nr:MFS transporter prlL [Pseudocercospora fuligena]